MKSLLLSLVLLSVVVAAQPQGRASGGDGEIKNPLVGAWRLVSIEELSADGEMHKADCAGMFVFTSDGKASVQVMYEDKNSGSGYARGGYEASYGTYRIDDASRFSFHIDGALAPTLIGKELKRSYDVSGNRLTVKSADPNEHWKAVWERY